MEILFWGLGAIGFWIVFGLTCLVLFALVENEKPGWATFLTLGTLLFFQLGTSFKPFSLAWAHPVLALLVILGYFLAGAGWTIGKWWIFVRAERRKYEGHKRDFLEANGVEGQSVPEGLRSNWTVRAQRHGYHLGYGGTFPRPRARQHKGRIMIWLVYWPWSFVWTMIDDPIKRAFRAIYNAIHDTLEAISKRAFAGVEDDFGPMPPETPEERTRRAARNRFTPGAEVYDPFDPDDTPDRATDGQRQPTEARFIPGCEPGQEYEEGQAAAQARGQGIGYDEDDEDELPPPYQGNAK